MTNNQHATRLTEIIRDISINNLDKETIWESVEREFEKSGHFLSWGYISQKARNDFLQKYIREDILDQGKTPCDTEALVDIYTYMYMLMHIDAFRVAKRMTDNYTFNDIYNDDHEEVLLVDFGCGPGTIPLAIAERYQPENGLNINYLGIDRESEMLRLSEEFFQTSLFTQSLDISISDDIIRVDNGIEPKKIIFVFSYLLSQPRINVFLESFISRIKDIMADHPSVEDFYLMYINKDYTGENYTENEEPKSAWYEFLDMLRSNEMVSDSLSNFSKCSNYTFRKFNNLDGNDIDLFDYPRPVYVKLFRLYKSEVNTHG
ncbi:class I SAM-dependent methyltransferase [Acinetobacter sp. TGL-Y2]|uniref:class I SAM-dependent methyltransferase n=1 Tax=Acinetobacter sp. TGL-Y2 TaxID=1407071 RepID=UPI00190310D4|nr:class I SAM-dependent methyltransferase [Acinetobacter sp. TGL-Y2]MBJ9370545.1 class I SAM-dependent methyltransferase [Acinetobacter sp. TGL-Y2]